MPPRPPFRTPEPRSILVVDAHRLAVRLAALIAVWAGAVGLAQSEWQVDVLIPGAVSVRMPTQEIAFGLTHADYPPETFPARYPATVPADGVVPVEVFVTSPGVWSLLLEIPDLVDEAAGGTIPADRILFRVADGVWARGSPTPQVIHTAVGPTNGWLSLPIAFELELHGDEAPGSFTVTTLLTALSDAEVP